MEDKIIGGEIQIEEDVLKGTIKRDVDIQYSLGRTCLYAILKTLKKSSRVEKVLLPDYVCNSVGEVPIRLRIPIKHYHIHSNFCPDMDDIRHIISNSKKNVAIILISYFGLIDLDEVIINIRLEFQDTIIIMDDVQNYYGFGNHNDFDYCFTSYRKWFAVPDGADVLSKSSSLEIEKYSQQARYINYKVAGNLLKNYRDMVEDEISLELLSKGEDMMDSEYRFCCSEVSRCLLQRMDFELIANKRRVNAKYLHEGLERIGIKHVYYSKNVPLFLPILVGNRDSLRERLFKRNIFAPIHWPLKDKKLQGENKLYEEELSLICDHRYNIKDMERILNEIESSM